MFRSLMRILSSCRTGPPALKNPSLSPMDYTDILITQARKILATPRATSDFLIDIQHINKDRIVWRGTQSYATPHRTILYAQPTHGPGMFYSDASPSDTLIPPTQWLHLGRARAWYNSTLSHILSGAPLTHDWDTISIRELACQPRTEHQRMADMRDLQARQWMGGLGQCPAAPVRILPPINAHTIYQRHTRGDTRPSRYYVLTHANHMSLWTVDTATEEFTPIVMYGA